MSISKVIKDAVTYPILDKKNWMIVGVFLIICNLINVFMNLNRNGLIAIIGLIAITVIIIILFGFNLSVTEYTIKGKTDYPKFNLTKNFMDGIKVVILGIIYYLIPTIITLIIAWLSGLFTTLPQIVNTLINSPGSTQTITSNGLRVSTIMVNNLTSTISQSVLNSFINGIVITSVCAIILLFIMTLFIFIGTGRMAETGSLKEGLAFKAIIKKIGSIGWGKYIAILIIFLIIIFILGIINSYLK